MNEAHHIGNGLYVQRCTSEIHGLNSVRLFHRIGDSIPDWETVVGPDQWAAIVACVSVNGGGQYIEAIARALHYGG